MARPSKINEGLTLSISKKLAAVISAASVVASMFAAAPANAESTAAFINRTISSSVDRPIDEVNHTVKFYAGEEVNLYMNGSIKNSVLSTKALANTVLTVDGGYSVVSGTMSQFGGKSIYVSGQKGNTQFNEMSPPGATELKITKTLDANVTNMNVNVNVSGTATTDVVLTFNPIVKFGDYVVTADDYDWGNTESSSRSGGSYNPESNGKVRVGRAEDERMNFYADTACVNTAGLAPGDVLESTMTVSDGTSNVGTSNPYWQIKDAQGMSNGPGTEGDTFTFQTLQLGSTLSVNNYVSVGTPVAGKTYTFGEVKIVKQGTTENLMVGCTTSAVAATFTVTSTTITATLDSSADTGNMGPKFESYTCALYSSTDASRTTVIKSSRGYMMMPMGGGMPTRSCMFNAVPAGTYVVGVRGTSWRGMSEEVIVAGTATVASADTTAPTVTGSATVSVTAPATAVATYAANEVVGTWSLSGANAALFNVSASGVVSFKAASAAGTYSVNVEATDAAGNKGSLSVAVTVTGSTPVVVKKKTPRVPTIATKVKAGKTFSISLNATKGTAKTAANLDGLVTKVVLASSSKGFCSITPVIKSKKIAGYTVKGLKVNATKCAVTITITGNALFNTLTKTVKVNVTK